MAKSTLEINDILSFRYQLLEEEGAHFGSLQKVARKITDHLDIYPSTTNIVAYENGKTVGTIRAIDFDKTEPLLRWLFDFSESVKALNAKCFVLDSWSLKYPAESHLTLARQLLKMALVVLPRQGVKFALSVIPSEWVASLRDFNLTTIAENLKFENRQLTAVSFDIEAFQKALVARMVDKEIQRFEEVFYVTLFHAGEPLVIQGERGQTAYLADEGEVEVVIKSGENLIPLSTISAGHLIGEIAMLTSEPRTASLIAKVDTSCFSFDRTDFIKLMYEEPHRNLDLFRIFSKRISDSNRRLSELQGRA